MDSSSHNSVLRLYRHLIYGWERVGWELIMSVKNNTKCIFVMYILHLPVNDFLYV